MSIQSTAQIGNIIRTAAVLDIKNWAEGIVSVDPLFRALQELLTVLEQERLRYVLAGGIALLHHVDGRSSQELEMIVAASSLEKLPQLKVISKDMYFVRADYKGLQIDVLLTQNPLFKQVQGKYTTRQHFLDRDIPIATVEGLLLLKLYALPSLYRQGNFARVGIYENDVATLMHYYQPNVSQLFSELSRYVSEIDLGEIKEIVAEIQKRIRRFKADSR